MKARLFILYSSVLKGSLMHNIHWCESAKQIVYWILSTISQKMVNKPAASVKLAPLLGLLQLAFR